MAGGPKMKKVIFGIFSVLALAMVAQLAVSDPAPFNFETNRRFQKDEIKQILRFQLNNAALFPSGDTLTMLDKFGNAAVLPAGADILHTYFYVKTATNSGSPANPKLGVTCGSATLLSATDFTSQVAGGQVDGNPAYNYAYNGSASNAFVSGNNGTYCTITATQSAGIYTTGKIYGFVEYVNIYP
jgi:hypothetical protein